MRLFADTHLLIWAMFIARRLPQAAFDLFSDSSNENCFSPISLWEIAIKSALNKPDFQVDARKLRQGLIDAGWREIAITGEHAVAVRTLPFLHKDPFDRLLIAQAMAENAVLVTSDKTLGQYGQTVRLVR